MNRKQFLSSLAALSVSPSLLSAENISFSAENPKKKGYQRLSLKHLEFWQSLQYGMFIHFGMSTYDGKELSDGKSPIELYNPTKLDVDSWVQIARDAGMKYAVLTTKHVAGHCLWPSKHTDYTVANSPVKTDVVEKFVAACRKYGVLPGLYYCSWDNRHLFHSATPSTAPRAPNYDWTFPRPGTDVDYAYTTSQYQTFQTAQITELLTQYGEIFEMWVDIPFVLGEGYRTFLYNKIAELQPNIVVMMNTGFGDGSQFEKQKLSYAWPTDLIAVERDRPPVGGHNPWRNIGGKDYYLPAEHCDPIGKEWFYAEGDAPRGDAALAEQFNQCRERNANFLLDIGPNKEGLVPVEVKDALMRLRKNVGL